MATLVGNMTAEELQEIIASVVEEKLLELLGDPEDVARLRDDVRDRLMRQRDEVARGERGIPLGDATERLGLSSSI